MLPVSLDMSVEALFFIDVAAKFAAIAALPLMVALSADGRMFVRKAIDAIPMTAKELSNLGLSVDDLNHAEGATLMSYLETLRTEEMTIADVKAYLESSIAALERELAGIDRPDTIVHWLFQNRRDVHLKARLLNLINLRDMLAGPERAKAALERQLKILKPTA